MATKAGRNGVVMKKTAVTVPAAISEVADFMAQIAELESKMKTIGTRLDTKLTRIKATADAKLEPLKAEGKRLFEGIAVYAEAHRGELTSEDKKSLELAAGILGWRLNPPSVEFDVDDETMVERLEKLGFLEFIRVEKIPNREAMRTNRAKAESISGVTFEQDEDFFVKIKTGDTEIEKKKKIRKKKQKASKNSK